MTSIKDYLVRVTKKGKNRGRPSKFEHYMSKTISDVAKSKEFKTEMERCINDMMMYGTGIFDTRKAMTRTEAKMKSQ